MDGKVKILYVVTESEWAGASRYVYDLATHLPPTEFDIVVAAAGKGDVLMALEKHGIKTVRLRWLPRTIRPVKDFVAFWEILLLYFRERPDIIHLNSSKAGFVGTVAAALYRVVIRMLCFMSFPRKRESRNPANCNTPGFPARATRAAVIAFGDARPEASARRVKPGMTEERIVIPDTSHLLPATVFTAHGWVFNEPGRANRFFRWLERFASHFRDTIICVSENDRQEALRWRVAPAGKLVTIHNGVDPATMKFLEKEEARRKLEIYDLRFTIYESRIIGCIANLYPNKGLEYLVNAIRLLTTNYSLLTRTVIIGSGPLRPHLEAQIKKHGLEDRVFLVGRIPEAWRYLKAFDCFVLASIKEGLPYAILEALAADIPVVATNVGGIPEIAKEAPIHLVPPENSQALADAIIKTLEEKPSNQPSFPSEFTLRTMVKKTLEVYINKMRHRM